MTGDFQFGPRVENSATRFRLWSPDREPMLEIDGHTPGPMQTLGDGWYEADAEAPAGARYRFRIGDVVIPDPASRMQVADVHGWSIVADSSAYRWRVPDWRGRPWEETVLYEIHPGLMGGFDGIAKKLPQWAELGITAIELMPIADFPGARNWGYDGVLPFAPARAYGTPDELKALIDAAHALGLMVFLDVVYNHFGPDGNYLALYASRFFRKDVTTPWGEAIDFREPSVRRFFIENALYWVHDFRIDGLRFDAVHAIEGDDFLVELASSLRASVAGGSRYLHLVLENDKNDSSLLQCGFDAQWNDDLHHVLHVMLTGENEGYYLDYTERPAEQLARALAEGFVYQGEPSPFRGGQWRGTSSAHLPPTSFVAFLQNHDQIGNRAFGERLTTIANAEALKAATALMLLCPQIPLLFMSEENGATEPFLYFTDHHGDLAEAVRKGRRAEFANFPAFADESQRARIPDPNAPETFARSRPISDDRTSSAWRDFYRTLLHLRRDHIVPRLKGVKAEGALAASDHAIIARWLLGDGTRLTLACNLAAEPAPASLPQAVPLWGAPSLGNIPPMTTLCWIETP